MIRAALLALALGAFQEINGEIAARLRAEPAEVEVGQPMRWILEVEHPVGAAVRLPEVEPIPDDSWVLLEPRKVVRATAADPGSGAETTRATWSVLSLEPGERPLPTIAIQVESEGAARSIEAESSAVAVRSALGAGEDAPRPSRGFHEAPARTSGTGLGLALAALLFLAAVAALWLRRRARAKPAAPAVSTPLERLAEISRALSPPLSEDPESGRRAIYALTRLLREASDRFLGEDRAALVDGEWAERRETDERLPLGARTSFARILRDAERVKYALHAPTRFALEAMLADAKNALEALEAARKALEKAA